ncbi:Cholecystokinin receptor [Pseudolycoriella hygida]|uniref:Cholecystokinin receptor n=1 Tax=Pseudolycoriella hygida TaxID=35572 RepID=A0A9Q0NAS0_9DIPT|nr:Cholecystokinin receptor [Pseudolycoriella hygida]
MIKRLKKMDINNGNIISDLLIDIDENLPFIRAQTRKTLPGWLDYSLIVLTDSQRLGIVVAAIFLCVLSVVANLATIIVNVKRNIRPFFRTCLLSLACSDLLTSIFQTLTYVSQLSNEYTPVWVSEFCHKFENFTSNLCGIQVLGELMCCFIPFVTTLAILVNSFTLVGIAVDRYLAIRRWVKGTWEPSKLFCSAGAVFLWGLAAGISSPMISSYYIAEFYIVFTDPHNRSHMIDIEEAEMCTSEKEPNQYYYSVVFFVIFLPLLIAFLWLNAILAMEIFSRRRPIPTSLHAPAITINDDHSVEKRTSETNTVISDGPAKLEKKLRPGSGSAEMSTSTTNQTNNSAQKRPKTSREIRQMRMFKVIIVIMITFFVCRLPTWMFLLYKLFHVANTNLHWMLQYCLGLLSITNCVLNPLLYTFLTETIQYSFFFATKIKGFWIRK